MEEEQNIIKTLKSIGINRHELQQKLAKLDEQWWKWQRELDRLQRVRITAANAKANSERVISSSVVNDLTDKTGLTPEQISKALKLMQKAKDLNDRETQKIAGSSRKEH